LFARLDQQLASFKQPRLLSYFDALPRLSSGKLDRAQIRTQAALQARPRRSPPKNRLS
jgi:acyl-CoA synthetase (AMP-forming)/AMP-acid ligase II